MNYSKKMVEQNDQNDNGNKKDPCQGYHGILWIRQGDREGAAGTIFFLFVLNQLIYADKYHLLPWIHLNNVSHHVYDASVHGPSRTATTFRVRLLEGYMASSREESNNNGGAGAGAGGFCPGKPILPSSTGQLQSQEILVTGNGVWNSYFEPVSSFDPRQAHNTSCHQLFVLTLTPAQILPGLHLDCPWSVRAWRYGGLADAQRLDHFSLQEWLRHHRERGARMVQKYVRPIASLRRAAILANPPTTTQCLALHVRHSDKANRRKRIKLQTFLPYVEAYLRQVTNGRIYLATDSSAVLERMQETWPLHVVKRVQTQGANVIRSSNRSAVFDLGKYEHHRTNWEVLVDILAMSRCSSFLHGLSAVSEAVHYFNPRLQNRSVNLEDPACMNPDEFSEVLLRNYQKQ